MPILTGETNVDLPAELFNIAYAELCGVAGDVYPITASTRDELDEIKPGWRKTTERPEYFVHDDKTLLLGAIPDAGYTLTLEFFRVPRKKMTSATQTFKRFIPRITKG